MFSSSSGEPLLTFSLPTRIAPVEQMYTRVNMRGANTVTTAGAAQPQGNSKDVVFLHGFNVDENAARGWHSEMFKRLWQSGSNARFPAMSGPVGNGSIVYLDGSGANLIINNDMNDGKFRNGWPRWHADYEDNWLHNDMKSVAYWYTSKLFDSIVTNGELK